MLQEKKAAFRWFSRWINFFNQLPTNLVETIEKDGSIRCGFRRLFFLHRGWLQRLEKSGNKYSQGLTRL